MQAPLRFGRFEIHPYERVLRIDGEVVSLGSRAFDVLLVLAQHHDRVVGKQELLDAVWPGVVVEEHNITVQISTLRKLLGPGAIATIPLRGYRFTATADGAIARQETRAARHNLPDARTRFFGREDALADLQRLVPHTRLLTLTGIGGCGKTRLALRFARDQLARFERCWFVDLSRVDDDQRVAPAVAAALGLREDGDTPLLVRIGAQLEGQPGLLVLDNCEHVRDGAAGLVEAIAATTTILTTSREPLGVSGEQLYPVRSLSVPATDELAEVLAAEAVRVFVDRAQLAVPELVVDAATAAPIAEICRRLDGIALAIELAAARVAMLSVAQIVERLDDRFRLLSGGGARVVPRHQTLQATMDWSYEQLSDREQRMLRDLSVFVGGWTLAAAVAVGETSDDGEALALLTALHDKSLLLVERDRAGGPPRYVMLETVRQYGLARLAERGGDRAARDRHAAHYVTFAEAAEPELRGHAQDRAMERLRREQSNLIGSIRWCTHGGGDPDVAVRLTTATALYWRWNGVQLGIELARDALARPTTGAALGARAGTLLSVARLCSFAGRYDEALAYGRDAVAATRELGETQLEARAASACATALEGLERIAEALAHHEKALALARLHGEPATLSRLLSSVGECHRSIGQLDAAESAYREALALAREHGGRTDIVLNLDNLVRLKVTTGRLHEARELAVECLEYARTDQTIVDLVEAVAGLASSLGEHARAARYHSVATKMMRAWGYRFQAADRALAATVTAAARAALGAEAFSACERAGAAMSPEAARAEVEAWLAPTVTAG